MFAVTVVPDCDSVVFHALLMDWLPLQDQVTRHEWIAVVPLLVMVIDATNPFCHWLSTWYVAVRPPVPPVGLGEVLGERDALGEVLGDRLGDALAEALADADADAVTEALADGLVVLPPRNSSEYSASAIAMSACAQNRWYVNDGTAPPFRYACTAGKAGSFLRNDRIDRNVAPGAIGSPLGILPDHPDGTNTGSLNRL